VRGKDVACWDSNRHKSLRPQFQPIWAETRPMVLLRTAKWIWGFQNMWAISSLDEQLSHCQEETCSMATVTITTSSTV